MNSFELYFKTLSVVKTPLIIMLDSDYRYLTHLKIHEIYLTIQEDYEADYFDCDDFALMFKAGAATKRLNGVGFVTGFYGGGLHRWNVVLAEDGVYQFEPQNGYIFKSDRAYIPLLVEI